MPTITDLHRIINDIEFVLIKIVSENGIKALRIDFPLHI